MLLIAERLFIMKEGLRESSFEFGRLEFTGRDEGEAFRTYSDDSTLKHKKQCYEYQIKTMKSFFSVFYLSFQTADQLEKKLSTRRAQ